jgi:hypothetical protein
MSLSVCLQYAKGTRPFSTPHRLPAGDGMAISADLGDLSEFYRILPDDMHPVRAGGAPPFSAAVHFALTDALTAYCGVARGRSSGAQVSCLKCLLKWASGTSEGRQALAAAFDAYRAGA